MYFHYIPFDFLLRIWYDDRVGASPSGPAPLSLQRHQPGLMAHGGDDFFHEVLRAQPQGGGVDAGVAAEELTLQDILIHQQLYHMLPIVHQAQNAQRTGSNVQIFFHILCRGKRKPRRTYLGRQILGLERLVPGKKEQIESRTLPVA